MQFVRKKKRGWNQKTRKAWFSEEGYRITWRKEVGGVEVTPAYHACVQATVLNYSNTGESRTVWIFVGKPLYKTRKAAETACAKHHKLWTRACKATGVRALMEVLGRRPTEIPNWVRKWLTPKVLSALRER